MLLLFVMTFKEEPNSNWTLRNEAPGEIYNKITIQCTRFIFLRLTVKVGLKSYVHTIDEKNCRNGGDSSR